MKQINKTKNSVTNKDNFCSVYVLLNNNIFETITFNKIFLIDFNDDILEFINHELKTNHNNLRKRFLSLESKIESGLFTDIEIADDNFTIVSVVRTIESIELYISLKVFEHDIYNRNTTKENLIDKIKSNIYSITNVEAPKYYVKIIENNKNSKNLKFNCFIDYRHFNFADDFINCLYKFAILENLCYI